MNAPAQTHLLTAPGIYNTSREAYDADPCPAPSLSASIAKLLLEATPAHAFLAHPRLNADFERESLRKFDLGTGAHALMLGEADKIAIIHFDDFKTKAAREAREEALAGGKVPMLESVADEAIAMIASARRQLRRAEEGHGVFEEGLGRGEQTIVWQEGDAPTEGMVDTRIWCRARPDWIPKSGATCWDYKTTGESANPERWVKTLFNVQGDLQPGHYLRGLKATTGKTWQWRWVVQEIAPPYALSICEPGEKFLELADYKMHVAREIWQRCITRNQWPGYPGRTFTIEPPPWEEKKMLERGIRDAVASELDEDELRRRAVEFYAPDHQKEQQAKEITP